MAETKAASNLIVHEDIGRGLRTNYSRRSVEAHLGHGLYYDLQGRICAYPIWVGTRLHRFYAALSLAVMFCLGWLLSKWADSGGWADMLLVAAAILLAAVFGWWLNRWSASWGSNHH